MPYLSALGEWKPYKRYSDNRKVKARLVQVRDMKLIEVEEEKGEEVKCPSCGHVISQFGGKGLPNSLLLPRIFHERHRPLETD